MGTYGPQSTGFPLPFLSQKSIYCNRSNSKFIFSSLGLLPKFVLVAFFIFGRSMMCPFQRVTWNVNVESNWGNCAKLSLNSSTTQSSACLVQRPFLTFSNWRMHRAIRQRRKFMHILSTSPKSRQTRPHHPQRSRRGSRRCKVRKKSRKGRSRTHGERLSMSLSIPRVEGRESQNQKVQGASRLFTWRHDSHSGQRRDGTLGEQSCSIFSLPCSG